MNAEHHRYAIRCLYARPPSLQSASWIGRAVKLFGMEWLANRQAVQLV